MRAWLSLGSNLDDPLEHLSKAVGYLKEKCFVSIFQSSAAIITQPYGYLNQPDFANQIIGIDTSLSLDELFQFVKCAELELGRTPTFKWGPRVIDIDILFYENLIVDTPELRIPHPGILNRAYLIKLLNDTIPEFVHPELKTTISELYRKFEL